MAHPFTAPAVSPPMMRRWKASTSKATGAVASTAPARTCPHGTWYCPRNSAMATGTVCRSGPSVNDRAKRNSFQQYTNVMIAVVAGAGDDGDHYVRVLLERVPLCPVGHARACAGDAGGRHR